MANIIEDDVRAMNLLVGGELSPQESQQFQEKLGVDDDDVKAWTLSKTKMVDNPTKDAFQTRVLDKVRTQKQVKARVTKPQGVGLIPGHAVLRGFFEGPTFGFSDNIVAGVQTGIEKISSDEDINKIFDRNLKADRALLKQLEDKYPLQFISSEIIGAILTPIPGSATAKTAQISGKLLNKFGILGIEAALTSAGKSEAEIGSSQFLEDVTKGTALGVGGGALLGKAGQQIVKLKNPVKKAAQFLSNVLFDLPPAYTERLLNPRTAQKILNPKSSDEIVDAVVKMTGDMGSHAEGLSKKAANNLSRKRDIDVITDVVKRIDNLPVMEKLARNDLPAGKAAKSGLTDFTEDLVRRADKDRQISEIDLKRYIQDLDKELPWNSNEWNLREEVIGDIRKMIDHDILKINEAYKRDMIPVDRIMNNLKDISKSFSLKRRGFKTDATDSTYNKVNSFFNVAGFSKKPITEKALKEAEGRFPAAKRPSVLEDIELRQIATRTEGGLPAGSKHILSGFLFGSLFGAPTAGVVLGSIKDRYGRKAGKSILPAFIKSIDASDARIRNAVQDLPPEIADAVLRDIGRLSGARTGVSASEEGSVLIPQQQHSLIPQR